MKGELIVHPGDWVTWKIGSAIERVRFDPFTMKTEILRRSLNGYEFVVRLRSSKRT